MKILQELRDGNYAGVFDGTPYRCECFGVSIRFISPDGKVRNGGGFYIALRPCNRRMTIFHVMVHGCSRSSMSRIKTRDIISSCSP